MRALLTGAAGFVGRNVLLARPAGRDWVPTWRGAGDFAQWCAHRDLPQPRACDLTDPVSVARAFVADEHFDVVVHLASNGDPARSVPEPAMDLRSGPLGLLTLFERIRARRLIYFSSGAVYDGCRGTVTPDTPIAPTLPYSIAKLAGEHYTRALRERLGRIDEFVNVRFFGAYGPWEPPRKIYTKLIRAFAFDRSDSFTIRGDGRNLIDAMFVDDAVAAVARLIDGPALNAAINLASAAPITLRELVERTARCFDMEPRIICEGSVPEYNEFHADVAASHARIGFAPRVDLETGLRRLHQHLLDLHSQSGALTT